MHMKSRLLLSLSIVFLFGVSFLSARAESSLTVDSAMKSTASVIDSMNVYAEKARPFLLAKKAELAERIAKAQIVEDAVEQTRAGQQINAAVGSDIVKPTRPTSGPTDTLKRVWLQCYRGLVLLGILLLDYKIFLYIIVAYIVYKLLRFVFGRFFVREL